MKRQLHADLQQSVLTLKEEVVYLDGVMDKSPSSAQWVQKIGQKRLSLQRAIRYLEDGLAGTQVEE